MFWACDCWESFCVYIDVTLESLICSDTLGTILDNISSSQYGLVTKICLFFYLNNNIIYIYYYVTMVHIFAKLFNYISPSAMDISWKFFVPEMSHFYDIAYGPRSQKKLGAQARFISLYMHPKLLRHLGDGKHHPYESIYREIKEFFFVLRHHL